MRRKSVFPNDSEGEARRIFCVITQRIFPANVE